MDRRRAAGLLLALAACVAYATAAPTASNHTSLDIYDGAPDGCYYNFQHYGEGDRIMTNEPCLNCTCHNRMLMCYLRVCPFTKPIGQDCTIEKRADQCCPIVTCPDVPVDLLTSTTTSPAEYGATGLGKLDKYGCSIHGKYFPEGSKVPPTPNKPCEHCYCIRNMTTCVMQECTLHVDGCTPIYHKDVCCPVRYSCDHPEDEMPLLDDLSTTVRPTPGFLLTTTTLSPVTQMSQECLYDNQIISDGALIKTEKACDHCYCMKGDIVCVVQECGTPMENEGKNCTALAPREGVCCPDTYICEGDEPTTGTYEADYTTELEKLITLSPPRRTGSEGSGYRNEPDSISSTELPTFEAETEGSGYEEATIHAPVITDALPESHKTEFSNEIASSTSESYSSTTTTKPVSYDADVTTKIDLQKDTESQHYLPSTVAQEEEIGSGEEEIVTSYEIASSTLPAVIAHEPTIASEPNAATTESNKEDDSETHVKEPTTSGSIVDKDQTNFDISTDDSTIEITTETRRHLDEDGGIEASTIFDEEYHLTEHDSLRTTVTPITESKSTASPEQHHPTASTSVSGFEDEIATEALDFVTDSSEGTGSDFDLHHQISMTASTPLLEEIEKDTPEQEHIPGVSSPDEIKTSTTLSNLPTEETVHKEILKPDLIDETISSNVPTTVSEYENDGITTAEPQKLHETDFEDSSESQQNAHLTSAPVLEDEIKEITPSDTLSTSKTQESQKPDADESFEPQQNAFTTRSPDEINEITPIDTVTASKAQESQETDVDESSEPQQNAPTTNAPVFEDETQKTTLSDSRTTSKTQETDVNESSERQQSTTSAPVFEDDINKITLSDTITTSKTQDIDVFVSSEPEQSVPFTNAPVYDDKTEKTTLSDSRTTSTTEEVQEIGVDDSSNSEQNVPTTSAPVYDDETKETTLSDSKTQEEQEKDVDKNSAQQNTPTTNAPVFVDDNKETTPAVSMSTSKTQGSQDTDLDEITESQKETPSTSAPRFEDEIKEELPADTMTTSKTQESQEADVDEGLEPQQNAPTTSAPSYDDETKKTTHTDSLTPPKTEEGQKTDVDENSESQYDVPTTSAPMFEDEIKTITPIDTITSSFTQETQKIGVDDDSDSQQYTPITTAPVYDDEAKKTTLSDFVTTSKIQEGQETDAYEHSEPQHETKNTTPSDSMATTEIQDVKESPEVQEYTTTPGAPVFDYVTKRTTPQDSLTTPEAEKHDIEEGSEPQHLTPTTTYPDEVIKTSSETIFEPNEMTTAEPDKGLNTIPSGSLEEETTEFAGTGIYTHGDEIMHTESATEPDNKLNSEKDIPKLTTLTPDTSASREDQFTLTTEPIQEENIHKIDLTEKYDLTKLTTVPAEIYSETYYDHLSSTNLPSSESQESSTSMVPLNTEKVKETTDSQKPIVTSSYESSSQATGLEDSIPDKHEDITSPPFYVTVPASTIADLEENEIINEPRIPGEGDCLLNGVTYRNESAVPSINKCQSGCKCSSSIIKCDPIICSSPPEYMDNCQATYDSLDSCCPTYVCDHKTETMPPQSHSQMSGTEAPVESPVKCNGDECVLSEDKNQVEASEQCKSGSCTSQDETVQVNIPDQTALDRHEECTGSKCTSSDPANQLCNEENNCQEAPVKPCEGTDCDGTSEAIPSQKQPCLGDHCDTPDKDCSAGKCDSDGENQLDVKTECTEKSCNNRKDGSELEQIPPKECIGSECPSKAVDFTVDLPTTDNIDITTEKIEKQSESPSNEIDHSTRPIENITDGPGEYGTPQTDVASQPSTTRHPDIMTTSSDVGSEKEKISPVHESATQKETVMTDFPDSTQIFDGKVTTEAAINLSDVTVKLEDVVTTKPEHTESPDVHYEKELTTEIVEKMSTYPPITYTTYEQEVTKLAQEIDDQEKTTVVSNENETEPNIIQITDNLVTQLPEKDIPKDTATSSLEDMFTEPPTTSELDSDSHDVRLQEVTKSPVQMDDDITAQTSAIYGMEEVTKLPQVDDVKVTINKLDEDIDSTTLKTYDSDTQETTKTPKETEGKETTAKPTDEFTNKPEATDIEKPSTSSDEKGSDELTKPDLEESSTGTSIYLEKEVTQSPEQTIELSTTIGTFEMNAQEVTKPSENTESEEITSRITEESVTEISKVHDSELQKVTSASDQIENEDVTKKSPITEPSIDAVIKEQEATKTPGAIEFTTVNAIAETDTDSSKYDDTLHEISVTQMDTVTDVTVSNVKDESVTESSKPDESEPSDTTESADDDQKTTAKVTKEVYTEPITQSSISGSELQLDITTTKPEDELKPSLDSVSLEESTTLQPNTASEKITQSVSVTDSISTETEKPAFTDLSTRIQPTETVVESATEAIAKTTTTLSELPIHKESDVTTISDRDILTASTLDLVTQPLSEVTISDKPSKDSDITDTTTETSKKTVTETLTEQNTEVPDEVQNTTEEIVKVNEITQKPPSGYEDDGVQENTTPEVPLILETEKDTISEETTVKPSVTTDDSGLDLKTEQPETISHPKEQLEKTTEEPFIDETVTEEPSKIDTSETKTPLDDELITKATSTEPDKLSENVTEMVKESVTVQYQDISTKPTEEETYTKLPMHSDSEAADIDTNKDDGNELTIPTVQISEVTEPNTVLYTSTKSSDLQNLDIYTGKPSDTPQDSLQTEVTELTKVESSTIKDEVADKEIQTMTPEISIDKESSTDDQLQTDMHKLSTASSQETYAEPLEENITTAKPIISDTEGINQLVTESVETVTTGTETKKPEKEPVEPSQPTATESVEITEEQDKGVTENILITTDTMVTKDSDSAPTITAMIEPTKTPETMETSPELSEMATSPAAMETSTLIHELSEATTSGQIDGENVSPVDKESSVIPVTVSDQQTVEASTESQSVLIDTATKKQEPTTELMEDELIPSKTEMPEMYPTTLSTTTESEKSTPSPKDETLTTSDQTLPLTSIEHHITEGTPLPTTVVSAQDMATQTPAEIEVQSDKATTPSETPLQPEPSPETPAQEEEKLTTAKAEELSTASPVSDKVTKPSHATTETPAAEQPRPIPTEDQPMDDIMTPDEEPSVPPSGASGYGTDPDYMEEDQTFGPGTCRYGGKVYVSAQQIPRDDPCDFCFCFRSDIICLQQSCPPPIHGCHEEPISGFCCPRYECPVSMATTVNVTTTTTTTTTTLPPHFPVHSYKGSAQKRGCLIKGHTYKVGEVVRASSGPCLHCTCGGDGQMKCDPKQCTPEPMLRQMIAAAVSAKRRR